MGSRIEQLLINKKNQCMDNFYEFDRVTPITELPYRHLSACDSACDRCGCDDTCGDCSDDCSDSGW